MVWPSSTFTATAVSRDSVVSRRGAASKGTRLAMGLGVWSEPQGYAYKVSFGGVKRTGKSEPNTKQYKEHYHLSYFPSCLLSLTEVPLLCCITHQFQSEVESPLPAQTRTQGGTQPAPKSYTKPVQCVQLETHKIQTSPLCTLLQFFLALSGFWKLTPQHCAKTVIPLFQPHPSQYPPKRHLLNSKGQNKSC